MIQADSIDVLRKKIAVLEWDLAMLTNADIIRRKKMELARLRSELVSMKSGNLRGG